MEVQLTYFGAVGHLCTLICKFVWKYETSQKAFGIMFLG